VASCSEPFHRAPLVHKKRKLIGNPADVFYRMLIHMPCWRLLVRRKDGALLDAAVDDVMRLYARLRAE
jgi:hypothetical protein